MKFLSNIEDASRLVQSANFRLVTDTQISNWNSAYAATSAATNANTANTLVKRDGSGNFSAGTITAALSGKASSATKLATTRTLWGRNFNGSANVTGNIINTGHITPSTSASSDIGSASLLFRNSYFSGTTQSAIFKTGTGVMQYNSLVGGIDFVC